MTPRRCWNCAAFEREGRTLRPYEDWMIGPVDLCAGCVVERRKIAGEAEAERCSVRAAGRPEPIGEGVPIMLPGETPAVRGIAWDAVACDMCLETIEAGAPCIGVPIGGGWSLYHSACALAPWDAGDSL